FAGAPTTAPLAAAPTPGANALSQDQMMRAFEIAALALIAIALVFYVLRPLFADAPKPQPAAAPATQIAATTAAGALPAPDGATAIEAKIDLSRVEGQVRASSIKQVSEVVKGHTDESVGILKTWIREAS
ncbi:MAG: hypothetical protein AAGJ87_07130, partial [Pseudomonadota bacterium]